MVVQGFFIPVGQIGWHWRWMHYISLHAYSFSAFMYNEFSGRSFTCKPGGMWRCEEDNLVHGETVLQQFDYEDTDKWANMAVLVAMMFVYRLIAAVWMDQFHTGKKYKSTKYTQISVPQALNPPRRNAMLGAGISMADVY
eukprot:1182199-Prorocentrum_minimum.AAC.4